VPRYKLTIAYDGTDFCGWQKQEPLAPAGDSPLPPVPASKIAGMIYDEDGSRPRLQLRTVQHVVERAITEIVRERIILHGSSRTDSGVHAAGQVAAFSCSGDDEGPEAPRGIGWPLSRGVERLMRAINGRLPEDVLVTAVEVVPQEFNPIRHTHSKAYSYTLHAAAERPLWDRRFVHHVWSGLDLAAMQRAASLLEGTHDFAAFAAAGHGRVSTVRTIFQCTVTQEAADRVRIDVCGSGFLWNMVRIIAGTLVEIGRGRMQAEAIPAIIASGKREEAGPTLPPTGLRLEWIKFGEQLASSDDDE
jgi:tRNA pseudouridine38-40 synthase